MGFDLLTYPSNLYENIGNMLDEVKEHQQQNYKKEWHVPVEYATRCHSHNKKIVWPEQVEEYEKLNLEGD